MTNGIEWMQTQDLYLVIALVPSSREKLHVTAEHPRQAHGMSEGLTYNTTKGGHR